MIWKAFILPKSLCQRQLSPSFKGLSRHISSLQNTWNEPQASSTPGAPRLFWRAKSSMVFWCRCRRRSCVPRDKTVAIKKVLKYEYSQPFFFSSAKENSSVAPVAPPSPLPSKQEQRWFLGFGVAELWQQRRGRTGENPSKGRSQQKRYIPDLKKKG